MCGGGGGREREKHKNSQTNEWCKPKSDDENFIFNRKNIQNKQTLKEITKKKDNKRVFSYSLIMISQE